MYKEQDFLIWQKLTIILSNILVVEFLPLHVLSFRKVLRIKCTVLVLLLNFDKSFQFSIKSIMYGVTLLYCIYYCWGLIKPTCIRNNLGRLTVSCVGPSIKL